MSRYHDELLVLDSATKYPAAQYWWCSRHLVILERSDNYWADQRRSICCFPLRIYFLCDSLSSTGSQYLAELIFMMDER